MFRLIKIFSAVGGFGAEVVELGLAIEPGGQSLSVHIASGDKSCLRHGHLKLRPSGRETTSGELKQEKTERKQFHRVLEGRDNEVPASVL